MENNNSGGQGPQQDAVKPIWEVIGSDTDTVVTAPPASEEAKQTEGTLEEKPVTETTTPETEVKPEVEAAKSETETKPETEVKPEKEVKEEPLTLELKPEDIKDAPTTFEDGTFQSLGEDFGLSVPEESFEAFKKAHDDTYILKSEAQKLAVTSKEQLYKTLDPKIAVAFELIDAGVPPELAFNPTKEHDAYLAMESAQLVRADLMNRYKDEEVVDAKMEELSADPQKLEVQARAIKTDISFAKEQILQEQKQIAQNRVAQNQQIALQQKTEAANQFKQALNNESTFMGLSLSKEVKDVILSKYNKGLYETALNPAQAQLRAILQLEYGDKFAKAVQSKAKEEGKQEIVRKLSDVAVKVTPAGGQRQQTVVADNNQDNKSPFADMPFLHQ